MDSLDGTLMGEVNNAIAFILGDVIEYFPRCPSCRQRCNIMNLGENPRAVIGNYKSLIFCTDESGCGWSMCMVATKEEYLRTTMIDKKILSFIESVKGEVLKLKRKKKCGDPPVVKVSAELKEINDV
jgi:hypothetical protein